MRILIVGPKGGLSEDATRTAKNQGADVLFCRDADEALAALRSGGAIEMVMADVASGVAALMDGMISERMLVPVVAFGTEDNARAAVAAIKAGAREYLPMP